MFMPYANGFWCFYFDVYFQAPGIPFQFLSCMDFHLGFISIGVSAAFVGET